VQTGSAVIDASLANCTLGKGGRDGPGDGEHLRAVHGGAGVVRLPKVSSEPRPPFRPAQVLSKRKAASILKSGDNEAIKLALIDASRCIEPEWVYPRAMKFARHADPRVRWGAFFALDQVHGYIIDEMLGDDSDPIHFVHSAVMNDPDEDVRSMASEVLLDMLCECLDRNEELARRLMESRRRRAKTTPERRARR
jgi:hypothetical protein